MMCITCGGKLAADEQTQHHEASDCIAALTAPEPPQEEK